MNTDDTFTFSIKTFDHTQKIHAIHFLRAVTKLRDGQPLGLAEAKSAIDRLQQGRASSVVIAGIPSDATTLVVIAARGAGINFDGQHSLSVVNV